MATLHPDLDDFLRTLGPDLLLHFDMLPDSVYMHTLCVSEPIDFPAYICKYNFLSLVFLFPF